jgi:hypothetical protein
MAKKYGGAQPKSVTKGMTKLGGSPGKAMGTQATGSSGKGTSAGTTGFKKGKGSSTGGAQDS